MDFASASFERTEVLPKSPSQCMPCLLENLRVEARFLGVRQRVRRVETWSFETVLRRSSELREVEPTSLDLRQLSQRAGMNDLFETHARLIVTSPKWRGHALKRSELKFLRTEPPFCHSRT